MRPYPLSDQISPFYSGDLPRYSSLTVPLNIPLEKSDSRPAEDVLHFLDHDQDTLTSLSLRYKVPIPALRRANSLTSDHLLLARRTVVIPGEFYKGGISLSPRPVEGEDVERKKILVRKWQVSQALGAAFPLSHYFQGPRALSPDSWISLALHLWLSQYSQDTPFYCLYI
jgi:LysM repeat protein